MGEGPGERTPVSTAAREARADWSPLTLFVLLGGVLATSAYSFALFHAIAEGLTIVIAANIFVVAWNSRHLSNDDLLPIAGLGMLSYALLGVPLLLGYPGIALFEGFGFNLAMQAFVAQRLVLVVTLVSALSGVKRKIPARPALVAFGAVTALVILSMMVWRNFPTMWVDGEGMTPLATALEVGAIAVYLAACVPLSRIRLAFDPSLVRMTLLALLGLALSSALLAVSHGQFGTPFLLAGHLVQVAAFYLGYRTVVVVGLVAPHTLLFRDNVRREQRLTKANAQLNAVSAISEIAISTLDLNRLLPALLTRLVDVAGADAAAILVPTGERLELVASIGFGDLRLTMPIGSGFSGTIAATRQPLYIADVQLEPTILNAPLRDAGIRSVHGVPLVVGSDLVGVLHVDWSTIHPYLEDDRRLLEIVADRMALAISNAQRFESERRIAEVLQESLLALPTHIDGIEYACSYDSATREAWVGGDFFDLFEIDADTIGMLIGDVSGKGIDAAFLTSLVKDTVRAHAHEGRPSPGQVLALTNSLIEHYSHAETFVTVFFGMLDRHSGALRYCNAGHPSVFWLSEGGIAELTPNSPILGAFPHVRFEDAGIRIAAGDVLVLYTDGVIEARDAAGVMFSEARLAALLRSADDRSPHALVAALRRALREYTHGALADDVAVLAVRYQ